MQNKIGIVILTLNAEKHLDKLLPPLVKSPLKPKILIVDSSSTDNTVDKVLSYGVEVVSIPRSEFNHGLTREKARALIGTEIVVFMTQDAYFVDVEGVEELVRPLLDNRAEVSYARQIPRAHADLLESFARDFNYPPESHIRSLKEVKQWGVYTFFISNSCSAYLNKALDEVGGFPDVLFGEDTAALAKLLHRGYKVAYVATSQVEHSHNYTLKEEFKRNFDIGLSRKSLAASLAIAGKDSSRGKDFALSLLKKSLATPWKTPYVISHLAAKWCGYKLGQCSINASTQWKSFFSSQPYYFNKT